MNFQEMLQQQLGAVNTGGNFDDNDNRPEKQLKHDKLYFGRDTSTLMVRILPPVMQGAMFAEGFRSIFLEATTENGKQVRSTFQLPLAPDVNSPLENAINQWGSLGLLANQWGGQTKPTPRFLVNAVQVQINPQDGSFMYEVDNQGQLMVRVLELPQSAFTAIGAKLQEVIYSPPQPQGVDPEVAQYGFISETNAYAIQITKPPKNSSVKTYGVDVISSVQLHGLPQGWQNLCEDLELQAQPTEVHSADFVNNFIGWFSNKAGGQQGLNTQQNFGGTPSFNGGQPNGGVQPTFNTPQNQQTFNTGQPQQTFNGGQTQQPTNNGQQQTFNAPQNQQTFNTGQTQQTFNAPQNQQTFNTGQQQNYGQPDPQGAGQTYVDPNSVGTFNTGNTAGNGVPTQNLQENITQGTNSIPTQNTGGTGMGDVPTQPAEVPNVLDLLKTMEGQK